MQSKEDHITYLNVTIGTLTKKADKITTMLSYFGQNELLGLPAETIATITKIRERTEYVRSKINHFISDTLPELKNDPVVLNKELLVLCYDLRTQVNTIQGYSEVTIEDMEVKYSLLISTLALIDEIALQILVLIDDLISNTQASIP